MKVAVFGKSIKPEHLEYLRIFVNVLENHNCEIMFWESFYKNISTLINFKKAISTFENENLLHKEADIVFSIGGDGTMLDTVKLVGNSGIPIVGINLGRMGFLSSIQRSEIIPAVTEILNNTYKIEQRTLIQLESPKGLIPNTDFAINELAINKKDSGSLITINLWVNNNYVHSYWADGLIIATPTGSTAYSLSCNGPILTPDSSNLIITPIAPHNLSVRPVVIPDNSIIRIKVESRENVALVSLDSQSAIIDTYTELIIRKADFNINLVQRIHENFFSTIRAKLNWGTDIRN